MNDESLNSGINWFELDRLVDGQLAPHEYRELLRQIDKDPDGWRQCALAFLQHQAIEKEMKSMGGFPAAREPSPLPADKSLELADKNQWGLPHAAGRNPYRRVGGFTLGILGACAAAIAGISAGSYFRSQQPAELASDQSRREPVANRAIFNGFSPPRSSVSHDRQQELVLDNDPHLCRGQNLHRDR